MLFLLDIIKLLRLHANMLWLIRREQRCADKGKQHAQVLLNLYEPLKEHAYCLLTCSYVKLKNGGVKSSQWQRLVKNNSHWLCGNSHIYKEIWENLGERLASATNHLVLTRKEANIWLLSCMKGKDSHNVTSQQNRSEVTTYSCVSSIAAVILQQLWQHIIITINMGLLIT